MIELISGRPSEMTLFDQNRVNTRLLMGDRLPGSENLPGDYQSFVDLFQKELKKAEGTGRFSDANRTIILNQLAQLAGHFQAKSSSDEMYNEVLGKTLHSGKLTFGAVTEGMRAIGKDVPKDEMYKLLLQKTPLSTDQRIICNNFAKFSAQLFTDLGLVSATQTINAGVAHVYTLVKDPKTGVCFLITAGNGVAKVIEGKDEFELREKYQKELIGGGYGGIGIGGVNRDKNGKVTFAQTAFEKKYEQIVRGGNGPLVFLLGNGPSAGLFEGIAGGVNYNFQQDVIQRKIAMGVVDIEILTALSQGALNTSGSHPIGESSIYNRIDIKTRPTDLGGGWSTNGFINADALVTYGSTSDGQRTILPQLNSSGLVGGILSYRSSDQKMFFTLSTGESFEILNPTQGVPGFQVLPSGQVVAVKGTYKLSDTISFDANFSQQNHFNSTTRSMGAGVDYSLGATGPFRELSLGANLSATQTQTVGALGTVQDTVSGGLKISANAKTDYGKLAFGVGVNQKGRLDTTFNVGGEMLVGAAAPILLEAGVTKDDLAGFQKLDAKVGLSYNLMRFFEPKDVTVDQAKEFFGSIGIPIVANEKVENQWIQDVALRFYIANYSYFQGNNTITEKLANLGVRVSGGQIFAEKNSPLYSSVSYMADMSVNKMRVTQDIQAQYATQITQDTKVETTFGANMFEFYDRFRLTTRVATTEDGKMISVFGGVRATASMIQGLFSMNTELGVTTTDKAGRIKSRGISLGNNDLGVVLGSGTLLWGGEGSEYTISLKGIHMEHTKNPGQNVVDKATNITIANKDTLYQYLSKDSEDMKVVSDIVITLQEIGKSKSLTLSRDFISGLSEKGPLKRFAQYLENNKTILSDPKVGSLHFESSSDWLGYFRDTEGTSYETNSKHLLIRSFSDTPLTNAIFTERKEYYPPGVEDLTYKLSQKGIAIKGTVALTENQIKSIEGFLENADTEYPRRMKNLTINIVNPSESNSNPQMEWNAERRILTLPTQYLNFSIPTNQVPSIVGINTTQEGKNIIDVLQKQGVKHLNDISVVKGNDSRFLGTNKESLLKYPERIDGKVYVPENFMKRFIELANTKPEDLSWREKMEFGNMVDKWKQCSVYPLEKFQSILSDEMSDATRDTARVATEAGDNTLYDVLPAGDFTISGIGEDTVRTAQYNIYQTNTKDTKGSISIAIYGNTEKPRVEIKTQFQRESIEISDIHDPRSAQLFQNTHPEITKILYGAEGHDLQGKPIKVEGLLQKLYKFQR